MANDALLVTTASKPQAQQLVNLSTQARTLHSGLLAFKEQLDHMTDGATYGTLETQCGLTAGSGGSVYSAIGSINTLLTNANFKALAYQVQQSS